MNDVMNSSVVLHVCFSAYMHAPLPKNPKPLRFDKLQKPNSIS